MSFQFVAALAFVIIAFLLLKPKRKAFGDKAVLFKSMFRPLNLTPHQNEKLPVKFYRGNRWTDDPEFEEFCQKEMTLAEFTEANSPFCQIKFTRPCPLKLSEEISAVEQEVIKKFTFLSKRVREIRNFRISTKAWTFPSHLDPANQLIMHITGSKVWWVKNKEGNEETFVCHAGDVLYIPIGAYHRTENLSPLCCIANMAFSYESDNYEFYEKKTRMLYPVRAMNVDTHNDLLSHRTDRT